MGMMLLGFLRQLVLALLVFELRHLAPHGWRAIGAEVGCIEKEREALLRFKAALGNDSSLVRWSSWGIKEPKRDCCQWEGVVCNNQTGHVIKLHLASDFPDFHVKGEIDASLMELQYLMYLDLSNNNFFGKSSIPEFLGSLTHLRSLDLNNCYLRGNIPIQLGLLSHLQYLNLAWNLLEGAIPHQLGNISNLQVLSFYYAGTLKIYQDNGTGHEWLSSLTSLTHLVLGNITDLKYSHKWLQMIAKLPNLKMLAINDNDLSDEFILSLPSFKFNSSSSLSELYLSLNSFSSSLVFHWILNISTNLIDLDLNSNNLEGTIPCEFASMMNSLESLDLGKNKLKAGLKSLGNICTLRFLNLRGNLLSEELSTILQNFSSCAKYSLQDLDLSNNQINSTLVSLSMFPSLKNFYISGNLLNGTIPEDFRFPSSLMSLDIQSNSLKGILTNSHLANMHNLKFLDLSNNLLTLRFRHNWVPPFQLEAIYLRSCKLGPGFPKWLKTQNSFTKLDISNNGISGTIPEWFWGLLTPKLKYLNVSGNNIFGTIPDVAIKFTEHPAIYLDSNQFEGPLPRFLQSAEALVLSNNNFSELDQFLCANESTQQLIILDLSNNQFFGQLPNCWSHFESLSLVDLSNNSFSGELPASIGSLQTLWALILRNNEFSGDLFITLKNC